MIDISLLLYCVDAETRKAVEKELFSLYCNILNDNDIEITPEKVHFKLSD